MNEQKNWNNSVHVNACINSVHGGINILVAVSYYNRLCSFASVLGASILSF